jgi:hypothetical protein
MQNGHFRLLLHTPDNSSSSYDEMVMKKFIAFVGSRAEFITFVGTRASLIPNVSRCEQKDKEWTFL